MAETELYTHPDYYANRNAWQTYKDLYEGDHGVLTTAKYLWYHELEGAVSSTGEPGETVISARDAFGLRSRREQRTQYYNTIEPIVSRYTSIFFLTPPTVDESTEDLLEGQQQDVTGDGTSFNSFIKDQVLFNLIVYGRAFVVTNAPSDFVANQTEEKAKRKPRFESLNPLDVKDWQVETEGENKGKLKFIRWEYTVIPPRDNPTRAPEVKTRSKVMMLSGTTFSTITYQLEQKEITQGGKSEKRQVWTEILRVDLQGWKELPVRAILNGSSWIKHLCGEALKLHNLISSRDNILYYQAYQRLFITNVNNPEQKKALTEYTISFLPQDAVVTPIEPVDTKSIEAAIEKTILNIFRMAYGVTRMLPVTSGSGESAESKQEDRKSLETLILSEIETIESLTNAILKDWAAFKGQDDFEGKVNFSRDLSSFDIQTEISLYQALRDEIMKIPTWRKQILIKFAETQNLNKIDDVKKEIEALPAPQSQGIQQNGQTIKQALSQRLNGRVEQGDQPQAQAAR